MVEDEHKKTDEELEEEGKDEDVDQIRVRKNAGFKGITLPVVVYVLDGTASADYTTCFFIANRQYKLVSVTERHEIKGTHGSAVTVMLNKVPSGTAPASGVSMLAAGLNLKSDINVNQSGTITATVANTVLKAGDSLALETTGTLTAVRGVTVSVLLEKSMVPV